ncbi:hydrocephalus-inducing protein-like [Oenanthe melanoleuca]|uniref:hydrocephalus-inducing protein-like n=1 Tax=Oenanthe melanoleuca TaxID=2939378 RepID=UPI0024C18949|nr:hydrocephalus-inducing protein-like [Oenanthe melanoleuca]
MCACSSSWQRGVEWTGILQELVLYGWCGQGQKGWVAQEAACGFQELHLRCIAHGPVVHIHPREINFGTIPVLKDKSKIIHLENHGVIPAPFWVKMARKRSCWRIEPSEGVLHPKCEVLVTVTASLDDIKEFKDQVKVLIENSHTTVIPVQAVGIGTTIVTDKNLRSELDLKSHFRNPVMS